jgi:uncharacterized protein GlcG (DUF336 family)
MFVSETKEGPMSHTFEKWSISHRAALRAMEATISRAGALGASIVVAVVDESGLLKAISRMDGAPVASIEAAQNKAFTALLGLPSGDLAEAVKNDAALLATLSSVPRMALIPGGVPIIVDGALVGAIGVGGGTVGQDLDCARAGVSALEAG